MKGGLPAVAAQLTDVGRVIIMAKLQATYQGGNCTSPEASGRVHNGACLCVLHRNGHFAIKNFSQIVQKDTEYASCTKCRAREREKVKLQQEAASRTIF